MIDTICGSEIGQIGVKISKLNFDTELYESNTTTCCAVYSLKRSTASAAAARSTGLRAGAGAGEGEDWAALGSAPTVANCQVGLACPSPSPLVERTRAEYWLAGLQRRSVIAGLITTQYDGSLYI